MTIETRHQSLVKRVHNDYNLIQMNKYVHSDLIQISRYLNEYWHSVVKSSRMFTIRGFLRTAYVGLKLQFPLSWENSVHSNHQNISSPVSENVRILKSTCTCSLSQAFIQLGDYSTLKNIHNRKNRYSASAVIKVYCEQQ